MNDQSEIELVSMEDQRKILHDGYIRYLKWKQGGGSHGFYYYLMNVWKGLDEDLDLKLSKAESNTSTSQPFHILFVEDEELKLSMMEAILHKVLKEEEFQAKIYYCSNGQSAFDLMQTQDFDIVFSDFRMPIMNGGELFEKVRDWTTLSKLQWIWTCADCSDIEHTLSHLNFVVDHIPSPFTFLDFQEVLVQSFVRAKLYSQQV